MEEKSLLSHVGRRTPAKGAHIDFNRPNLFFVTVGAKDRVPWMGQPEVQIALVEIWRDQLSAWKVGRFLLMPDHLHFFGAPYDLRFPLDDWIAYWKSVFSRIYLDKPWRWQRNAFHHRIRSQIEYAEKWAYIRENPLRKGLVKNMEDWKLQGEVHPGIGWH